MDSQRARMITRWLTRLNQSSTPKRIGTEFSRQFSSRWVRAVLRHRVTMEGHERLTALHERSIVLCANHRSFFDFYILMAHLFPHVGTVDALYFPVRGEFFYTQWAGFGVNLAISGGAMWPPIWRKPSSDLESFLQLAEVLRRPRVVVGIHPEGRRHTPTDAQPFAPPKPGIAHLAERVDPDQWFVPVYMDGLSNDFAKEVKTRWTGPATPITLKFGEPLSAQDILSAGINPIERTEFLFAKVRQLGQTSSTA